jgi:hypothetical protein
MRAALSLLLLAGCASPNLYTAARPLGAGRVQHALALEGTAAVTPVEAAILPSAPTYQLGVGLHERVDLMVRLVNLTGLGVDTLVSLHQGTVDVALVPGLRGAWLPFTAGRPGALTGHLPLVLGIHLGPRVQVLTSAGVGFTAALGDSVSAGATSEALPESLGASSRGFFMRAGLGLRLTLGERFTLQPEVSALFSPESGRLTLVPGLAFVFGAGG